MEPRATQGPVTAHLPVSVRGDRLGVLSVTAPESSCSPAGLAEMQQICEALGHEILVAERDTDLYLLARRATRLTLAAEMQWQLLPDAPWPVPNSPWVPTWSPRTPSSATTSTGRSRPTTSRSP